MNLNKHIGRAVEMIYEDCNHKITQRQVTIRSLRGDNVIVFDHGSGEPRSFKADRVLAAEPVRRHV